MAYRDYFKKRSFQLFAAAIIIAIIVIAALIVPWETKKPEVEYPPNIDEGKPPTTISHNILAEMFMRPDCYNCSSSEKALTEVDENEDRLIHIVHLVGEINGAEERYEEAKNGSAFPDVEFDGGYRSLIGKASYRDYLNKTMECMTRTVIWVNLNVTVKISSNGYVAKVKAGLPGGSVQGTLRVYLVEKESTDYFTSTGDPIHNLVIQYLYDKTVVLKASEETVITLPLNYVENIDNLAVVAAFYIDNGHSEQVAMGSI